MDLFTVFQGALAWFYLMLILDILMTSTKNVFEKQYTFEGRLFFLAYAHMVYFDSVNIFGFDIISRLPILNFFLNDPIKIAFNWINTFTTSLFGLPLQQNPLFMFTHLLPIFFIYNFTEYWFKYGFSDKRISKLIAFAAVVLFIGGEGSLGFISSLTAPFTSLVSGLVIGGGVFAIFNLLVGMITLIPFIKFDLIYKSLADLVNAIPVGGIPTAPETSGGILSTFVNILGTLGINGQAAYVLIFFALLLVVSTLIYMLYKVLMGWMVGDLFSKFGLIKQLSSWSMYFGFSLVIFGLSFSLFSALVGMIGGHLTLPIDSIVAVPASMIGFVSSFIVLALLSEILVFVAMAVLFNNLKYVFEQVPVASEESGPSGETQQTVSPSTEEDDGS